MTPEPHRLAVTLARPPLFGHHGLMPKKPVKKDAVRVHFVAPPGSKPFYKEAAKLAGIPLDAWIRITLHAAATEVFEAHGRDTTDAPDVHIRRPPRLQPRYGFEDGGDGSDKGGSP